MSFFADAFRRLWKPHKGLFWLMLGFNALASFMTAWIQITEPPTTLRLLVGLLALSNSLIGWWLAVRLWREPDPA